MTIDDFKTQAPEDLPENTCPTCGEKCEGDFCNRYCFNARDM